MAPSKSSSKRKSWKEWKRSLPAFLDASSSVAASTFGARRLPELKALHRQCTDATALAVNPLKSGGHKTSTRHLRRRTTSYRTYKRHRFPTTAEQHANKATATTTTTSTSRKARRKPAVLREQHSAWHHSNDDDATASPTNWLQTHLWHAKRFHMANMFGWSVPLQHTNRGSRAVQRLLNVEQRTIVQDITWRMQPLVLTSAAERNISNCMKRLCPSFQLAEGYFGEGMLHEPDAFPNNAIGPAKWWMRRPEGESSSQRELLLFLHPSTKAKVKSVLSSMLAEEDDWSVGALDGGIACFQLRGQSSTDTIQDALQIPSLPESHQRQVTVATRGGVVQNNAEGEFHWNNQDKTVLLVRDDNEGWSILCPVADAHEIFLTVVLHRNAVVIGSVEDYHILSKTVFPRDFPDSEQGRLYWEATNSNNNWRTFRAACECGTERLKPSKVVQDCFADIEGLARSPHGNDGGNSVAQRAIVVVRGHAFGQPFVDLLQQCARIPDTTPSEPKETQRRKRRRSGIVQHIRLACFMSTTEALERMERTNALASSLSLAALIRCKIQIRGRGTLQLGDEIHGCSVDNAIVVVNDTALGSVVEGSFSNGSVQGTGFVGAARLLHFLAAYQHPAMMFDGDQLCLVVQASRKTSQGASSSCKGILSLIL